MEHRELAVVGGWPLFRRNWSPEFLVIVFSACISAADFCFPLDDDRDSGSQNTR
jgi:hypothetical protein